jgi:hypothetical protein
MSNAFLAEIDAVAHELFADQGIADRMLLRTPSGAAAGPADGVRCWISRGIQIITDEGAVTSNQTAIDLLRADLPAGGVTKGWVLVLADGEYTIDSQPQSSDESIVRYLLRRKA